MRSNGAKSGGVRSVGACGRSGGDVAACADVGLQLCRFGVFGAKLQGEIDFALGSGEVAPAQEGDGEVVVVVRVVGVGG